MRFYILSHETDQLPKREVKTELEGMIICFPMKGNRVHKFSAQICSSALEENCCPDKLRKNLQRA